MCLISSCSCLCSIHWSQVLSREWRCSWSSADRRCSNYIWVVDKFIAYLGATYIRCFTVDVPRMVETLLAIAICVSATSVDHPGWPAAVSAWTFAQWLILSCLVTSKVIVFAFGLTLSVTTSCHKNETQSTSVKSINIFAMIMQSEW